MTIIEMMPMIHQSARGTTPVQAANTSDAPEAQPGHPRWKKPASRKNHGQIPFSRP
jgi:hypothetical protein